MKSACALALGACQTALCYRARSELSASSHWRLWAECSEAVDDFETADEYCSSKGGSCGKRPERVCYCQHGVVELDGAVSTGKCRSVVKNYRLFGAQSDAGHFGVHCGEQYRCRQAAAEADEPVDEPSQATTTAPEQHESEPAGNDQETDDEPARPDDGPAPTTRPPPPAKRPPPPPPTEAPVTTKRSAGASAKVAASSHCGGNLWYSQNGTWLELPAASAEWYWQDGNVVDKDGRRLADHGDSIALSAKNPFRGLPDPPWVMFCATQAEFHIEPNGHVFYDVSIIKGFDVPLQMTAIELDDEKNDVVCASSSCQGPGIYLFGETYGDHTSTAPAAKSLTIAFCPNGDTGSGEYCG